MCFFGALAGTFWLCPSGSPSFGVYVPWQAGKPSGLYMFASDLVFGLGLQGLGITAIHVDIQPCGMFGFVMIGLVRRSELG